MIKAFNKFDQSFLPIFEKYADDPMDRNILIDASILLNNENPEAENSVAWLTESMPVLNHYGEMMFDQNADVNFESVLINHIKQNALKSKRIYTWDKRFAEFDNAIITDPPFPSWVSDEDSKIYDKTDSVCFITSNKAFTPVQETRVQIAEHYKGTDTLHVFGRGYNEIDNKVDALASHRFCIVIENAVIPGWHTEKILDCYRTGTVPIYVGDPCIGDKFNTDGMLFLKEGDILDDILNSLNEDLYQEMLPHVKDNFDRAMKYNNMPHRVVHEMIENERQFESE